MAGGIANSSAALFKLMLEGSRVSLLAPAAAVRDVSYVMSSRILVGSRGCGNDSFPFQNQCVTRARSSILPPLLQQAQIKTSQNKARRRVTERTLPKAEARFMRSHMHE